MSTIEILGFAASVFIGISLGLIGGGGSILTVPVLVYLIHVDPVLATAYSLFVVEHRLGGLCKFSQEGVGQFENGGDFRCPFIHFGIYHS